MIAGDRLGADRLDQDQPVGGIKGTAQVGAKDRFVTRAAPGKNVYRPRPDRHGRNMGSRQIGNKVSLMPRQSSTAETVTHADIQPADRKPQFIQRSSDSRGIVTLDLVMELDPVETCGRGGCKTFGKWQGGEQKAGIGKLSHRSPLVTGIVEQG